MKLQVRWVLFFSDGCQYAEYVLFGIALRIIIIQLTNIGALKQDYLVGLTT